MSAEAFGLFSFATSVLENIEQPEKDVLKMFELVLGVLAYADDDKNKRCYKEVLYWHNVFVKVQAASTRSDLKVICKQYVCVSCDHPFVISQAAMKAAMNLMTKYIYKFITNKDCASAENVRQVGHLISDLFTEIATENNETLEEMMARLEA